MRAKQVEVSNGVCLLCIIFPSTFCHQESDEMRARQVEVDRVAEVMHFISHAYHSITDIMVNLAQPPPRQLRAGPVTLPTGAFMHHIAPQVSIACLSRVRELFVLTKGTGQC